MNAPKEGVGDVSARRRVSGGARAAPAPAARRQRRPGAAVIPYVTDTTRTQAAETFLFQLFKARFSINY